MVACQWRPSSISATAATGNDEGQRTGGLLSSARTTFAVSLVDKGPVAGTREFQPFGRLPQESWQSQIGMVRLGSPRSITAHIAADSETESRRIGGHIGAGS